MGLFEDAYAIGRDAADGLRERTEVGSVQGVAAPSRSEAVSRVGKSLGFNQRKAERVPVPSDSIEKYWDMYRTVPVVRASLNQFRDDVMASGYRMTADSDDTTSYLTKWAETAGIANAERGRDLHAVLREIPIQTKARGTTMLEKNPTEGESDDVAGASFINPSTVTPYRASDTDMLLRPDDTQYDGAKLTEEGKAAAFVQFDNDHHPGDPQERRLTLDDVVRILNDADPHDVFGTSDIAPAAPRIESLREKMLDVDRAVSSMGWGQWFVGFDHEKVKNDDGSETIVEWKDGDMDDFMEDLEGVEPGDVEGHDGTVNIKNLPGEIPQIVDQLKFEINYILVAMPAPTYAVGFESDINQFVVDGQETRHEQRVNASRGRIERGLRPLAVQVAGQSPHSPEGSALKLEPPEEDSPVLNLSDSEVEKMERFATAFEKVSSSEARTLLPDEVIREEILQIEGVGEDGGFSPAVLSLEDLEGGGGGDGGTPPANQQNGDGASAE